MKIWIPWADANAPFFYEDAAFIGLKRDVKLLADRKAEDRLGILAEKQYGWFAHVIRFALPFFPAMTQVQVEEVAQALQTALR